MPHSYLITILHWALSAFALMITSWVVPGFHIRDFFTALIAAGIIGLINILIRPALLLVTLPLNILTLGFFTFVVNAIVLKLCAALLKNFEIKGWFSAIIGAIVLAVTTSVFQIWFW